MRLLSSSTLAALAALAALTGGTLACSGASDGVDRADTGSSNHGVVSDAGNADTAVADAPPADVAPAMCWLAHPSDPNAIPCDECSQSSCAKEWSAAYGAGFARDDFTGGACADDARCMCGCAWDDDVCIQSCDISEPDACLTAKQALYACESASCAAACGRT